MRTIQELINLRGRVALVTGGGGHIGSSMSEALAEMGATTVVLDISEESCTYTTKRIIETYGVESMPLTMDLSDEAALRSVPDIIVNRFGRLDILVNCAALVGTSASKGWAVPFQEQSSDMWRSALEVNLTAPFVLVQACANALAASGKGSVTNVSSIYGIVGPDYSLYKDTDLGNPAAYAASKGALVQLTRWLATTMAPSVRVNAITIGGVWREQPRGFHDRYVDHTPLRRMATEEDLKGAIVYLSSDLSAYVTGHNLIVDGGWTVW